MATASTADYETPFPAFQHIPGLDRGGWHDAGDYDLAAGSQAGTTYHAGPGARNFWPWTATRPR